MPAGVPTDHAKVEEFRAHYLYSGNAAESARAVELAERTGQDLARKLAKDPDFAADRAALRKGHLHQLEVMRMKVAEKALERFEEGPFEPEIPDGAAANITVIDKCPDYGKLVLEAEKNAHNLAKIEAVEGGETKPAEVHITVSGPNQGELAEDG